MRATGITWRAVRGDNAHDIREYSGHKHLTTLEIYIRQAKAMRDVFGKPFPTLPPELLGKTEDWGGGGSHLAGWTGLEPAAPSEELTPFGGGFSGRRVCREV